MTPSYNKLVISYDLRQTNFKDIKKYIENLEIKKSEKDKTKKLEIPVCFHENFSIDIRRLEEILNLKREKILENFLKIKVVTYFLYSD